MWKNKKVYELYCAIDDMQCRARAKARYEGYLKFYRTIEQGFHMLTHYTESLYILVFVAVLGIAFVGNPIFADTTKGLSPNEQLIFPLKKVTTLECRATLLPWSQQPESCKISLPRIYNTTSKTYEGFEQYHQIFTVLWGASYEGQRDIDVGDHDGVDIASANGTPLYAIANGIVTDAGWNSLEGNVVRIMFTYQGKTYHAIYEHMKSISVQKGDTVFQGQRIGELGNTGNVYGALGGNHLHFAIAKDFNGRAIFSYSGCPAIPGAYVDALTLNKIVSQGLCRAQREMYQVDPWAFIANSQIKQIEQVPTPPATTGDNTSVAPGANTIPSDTTNDTHAIAPELDDARQVSTRSLSLRPIATAKLTPNTVAFLRERDIKLYVTSSRVMSPGQEGTISIHITKKNTKQKYTGVLPSGITLISPTNSLALSTSIVNYIQNGEYKVNFSAQQVGRASLSIGIDGITIANLNVSVE